MELVYIALLTLVAALIGTITGFGTSTLMIPVLVIFFPPVQAIFLVAISHWFGEVLLRLLGVFLAGYALFLIFQSAFRIRAGNVAAVSGGALSGFFAGMFGIGGAIRIVDRIPQSRFRFVVVGFLVVVGMKLTVAP